jgi:hypothetical protein
MLVEKITGNLRPMVEVEKEIRELQGNQSKRRNILTALSELEVEHASKPEIEIPESQVEQNTQPGVATEEKQDQNNAHIPLVVDKETGQISLFDDVVMNTTPEVFAAESSTHWEFEQKQDERNMEVLASRKDFLAKVEKTQDSVNQEVNTEAVQITENPVLEGLNGDGTEPYNSATKHKTADNVQNNAANKEENAKKPYYQLNAEKFLAIIKDGSAPFIQSESDTTAVFINPKAVLSATTARAFKGINQLLAQNALMEAGITDTQIITYEQAKEHGVGIKKGQLNFVLTNYDVATRISSANRYYPVSAVYNREQLPPVEARPSSVKVNILCTESDPATYLGKYLAATAMNARFETTKDTQQEFREKIIAHLETSFAENKHSKAFELGNKASAICRATMSEIFSKLQIHSRNMSQQSPRKEYKGIQIEPHNPVTGEVFVGENAKKAAYLMERRNSRDPRFIEYADILKAGLELKADAKEMLTVKDQGKTRFFYNAVDIEGMPPHSRQNSQRFRPPTTMGRKENSVEMEM